jgi:hypothetical protein
MLAFRRIDLRVLATVAVVYLIVCPFLPPSLFSAISANQQFHGAVNLGAGSFVALGIVAAGCGLLAMLFHRLQTDAWLRFAGFFTWITLAIPLISAYLGMAFLPQAARYKVEAEAGLAVVIVFCLRAIIDRMPVGVRIALALVGIGLAAQQVVSHRRFAKAILRPADPSSTIEYKVARWVSDNLPGRRVWLPGSLAHWFNTWSDGQQMTGGSWSTAYNQVHQRLVFQSLYSSAPEDAGNAFLWLRAYGVYALAIPGPKSPEFWKAIARPQLFEGCEVLWKEDDTTICRVPGSTGALAHVLSPDTLIRREPHDWRDVEDVRRLDLTTPADLRWEGTDAAFVRADVPAGKVLALQVTHHPGWSAKANGKAVALHRDALGLMWLDPECNGACDVRLDYDGGWELRLCRWISALTLFAVVLYRTLRIVTVRLPQVS